MQCREFFGVFTFDKITHFTTMSPTHCDLTSCCTMLRSAIATTPCLWWTGISGNTLFVWINYNSVSLDTSPVPVPCSDDRGSNVEDSILKAHCSLFSTTTDDIPAAWYIFTPSIELVPFQQHMNTCFYRIACCMCTDRAQTQSVYIHAWQMHVRYVFCIS